MKAIWIVLWGPSAVAWFVFEAAVSLSAQWHHANIDLPDSVESKLKHVIVTPRYHAMHHMVDRSHGDAYFSTVFSIWDVIWKTTGTYQTRDEMRDVALGLPDGRETGQSLLEWILEPVRKRNLALSRPRPSETE